MVKRHYPTPISTQRISRRRSSTSSISPTERYLEARRGLSRVAGGTLGFIGMGVPGAVIGGSVGAMAADITEPGEERVSLINMNRQNPTNQMANRAVMTKRGRKALRAIPKKKKVKVSKVLRKKVTQILKEKGYYGDVHKVYGGTIGTYLPALTVSPLLQLGPYADARLSTAPATDGASTYNYTWWQCPIDRVTDATPSCTALGNYSPAKHFAYFTPIKFLDAASILWNRKVPNVDPYIETGNLTTRVNSLNQLEQGNSANLKLEIVNSYVQFTLKNCSQRALTILIRTCVPKSTFATRLPLDALAQDLFEAKSQTGSVILAESIASQNTSLSNAQVTSASLAWSKVSGFKNNWKVETTKIIIKPGEECVHSLQGPKNFTLDFKKCWKQGSDLTSYVMKGTGACAVVMGVLPDPQVTTSSDFQGFFGHLYDSSVAGGRLDHPVAVKIDEVYKLRMPEQVGFVNSNVAAGAGQPLTLRSGRSAMLDFLSNSIDETKDSYAGADEQQPGTMITDP